MYQGQAELLQQIAQLKMEPTDDAIEQTEPEIKTEAETEQEHEEIDVLVHTVRKAMRLLNKVRG